MTTDDAPTPPDGGAWTLTLDGFVDEPDPERARVAVRALVGALRDPGPAEADRRLDALCVRLEADRALALRVGRAMAELVERARCTELLVEAGIPEARGFVDGALLRVGRRLLPDVPQPRGLRATLAAVFDGPADHRWLSAIRPETGRRFVAALGLVGGAVAPIPGELAAAIRALAHHVASLGLSPDITRLMPEVDDIGSPFLALSHVVLAYVESMADEVPGNEGPMLEATLTVLDDCRALVARLRAEKHRFGTSLRLTALTRRLSAQIDRLDRLLHLTEPGSRDVPAAAWALTVELVEAEHTRTHLGPYIRSSADLLAFQVVEHAARAGTHYITRTAPDYLRFLRSSLIGGAVVGLFALFKIGLDGDAAPALEGLMFGLNYAVCFVAIGLVGGTLATKQPAMTANTLARTMAPDEGRHDVEGLADLIVRVARSQFISFVGNLAAALPVGAALAWVTAAALDAPVVDGDKARLIMTELHPWHSLSLFYAAIAGVFLSTAGLVSGWLDNRNLYRRLPQRVAAHPGLCRVLGPQRAARLGGLVERKLGTLGGNVYLGLCLGLAGSVGFFLGLPIDIRHIAFASAHFGMALVTPDVVLPAALVVQVALGVALIGLVNFIVSFGSTLLVALWARHFSFGEGRALVAALARRFVRRPWRFFVPPLKEPAPPAAGSAGSASADA